MNYQIVLSWMDMNVRLSQQVLKVCNKSEIHSIMEPCNYGTRIDVLKTIFKNPSIEKAVDDFNSDWYAMYGEGTGICDLPVNKVILSPFLLIRRKIKMTKIIGSPTDIFQRKRELKKISENMLLR